MVDVAESRHSLNFAFDQVPMLQARPGTWDSANDSKVMLAKPGLVSTMKSVAYNEHASHTALQNPTTSEVSSFSTQLMPSKGGDSSDVFQRGIFFIIFQETLILVGGLNYFFKKNAFLYSWECSFHCFFTNGLFINIDG